MDAATLQARINSGYSKAATRIGYSYTIYRPSAATNPIVAGNIIGSPLNAAFTVNASTFNFNKAGAYKDALWLGLFDRTTTLVGDYLYNATHGTYFIAAQQDILPTLCVKCNNTVSVTRQAVPSPVGSVSYGGVQPVNETAVRTSYPAMIITDRMGRSAPSNLPATIQLPIYHIFLPTDPVGLGAINRDDVITDQLGIRYLVSDPFRSLLGYELTATLMAM